MNDRYEELDDLDLDQEDSQGVLSKTLRNVGVIALVCVGIALFVGSKSDDEGANNDLSTRQQQLQKSEALPTPSSDRTIVVTQAESMAKGTNSELVIKAGAHGQFQVTADVNDTAVRFLVDTGASDVILTHADAEAVGFNMNALDYNQAYSTANGVAYAAPVSLERVSISDLELDDVKASVMRDGLSISLLGMSFLRRLEGYQVANNSLILTY